MELSLWSSVTPLCSVSLHPSRIIEHLMYFKNSLRGATNIPLGVIRVLFKIMCNKGKYSYITTKCYKNVFIAIQIAHRHIKPRKLTFNYCNKFSSITQHCRHSLINNTAILRYIGLSINEYIICDDLYLLHTDKNPKTPHRCYYTP